MFIFSTIHHEYEASPVLSFVPQNQAQSWCLRRLFRLVWLKWWRSPSLKPRRVLQKGLSLLGPPCGGAAVSQVIHSASVLCHQSLPIACLTCATVGIFNKLSTQWACLHASHKADHYGIIVVTWLLKCSCKRIKALFFIVLLLLSVYEKSV